MADDQTTVTTIPGPGLLTNQPQNANFLSPLGFRFVLKRAPTVNFFCTQISIPSFELGEATMPTPFKNIPLPGDKPRFGDLTIEFKVDEQLKNYLEIFNWMAKIGYPEKFEQYASVSKNPAGTGYGVVSDATVIVMNSSMDPTTEFRFENMFPSYISDLNFTSTESSVNYISARATFKFEMMRVITL